MIQPEREYTPTAEQSPTQALAFLWRGRWWIGALTVLAAAAGVFYAEHRGTIYRARSVLYVQRNSPVMPGNDVSLWLQSRNYANTQAALLRSTPVMQATLARPGIGDTPLFGDSKNHLAWFKRNLNVAVGMEDDLITVSLDSGHVEDACTLVNSLVDSYLEFHAKNRRETTVQVLASLTSEWNRYENEVKTVQAEEAEFIAKHPGVGPSTDVAKVAAERLRELNLARTRAEIDMLEAEAVLRSAQNLTGSAELLRHLPGLGAAAPSRADQDDATRLHELRQKQMFMATQFTPDHPELKRGAELIAALEKRIADADQQLAQAYIEILGTRHKGMKQKHDDLIAKVAEQERLIQAVDPAQAEYRAIEGRRERARKMADQLYERVRVIGINSGVDGTDKPDQNTLVYEYASAGSAIVTSSKTAIAMIATFLGLVAGLSVAWFRSLLDQRLRSPDDVARQLPLLTTLPPIRMRRNVAETWRRSPVLGEAMRSLSTAIHYGARGRRSRVLQITSAREREGRSLITAGLGIAMAQGGQRTLIIDADFQQAAQARLFGVDGEAGLLQVLAQGMSAVHGTQATAVKNLYVLPAGSLADGGTLLDSARLAAVLQDLTAGYDRILIDSPPLLRVVDARIIAAVCDGTVLVVRSGSTTSQLLSAARGLVTMVSGHLLGAVLNRSPRQIGGMVGYLPRGIDVVDPAMAEPNGATGNGARRESVPHR